MGYGSQAGQVILRTQTVAGTYNSDTGTAGIAIKLRSGGLGINRDLLIPDPEIGGGRDTTDAYLGAAAWSGEYEFYARLKSIITLLKAGLGTADAGVVVDTTAKKFTFTPADTSTLPLLSIEEKIGSGLETFHYWDAVVNSLHLESDANGYLQGTAGIISPKQLAGATPTVSPSWDSSNMLVGTNTTVTYNSVQLPARSFNFDFSNNFEDDVFGLGGLFLVDLTAKGREITSGFSIRPTDSNLFRQAAYGATAATTAGGTVTKAALVIDCKTYEKVGTLTALGEIKITIPSFVLSPYSFDPSGDDVIENDIEGRAVRPSPGTPICTIEVTTDATVIA